MSFRKYVVKNKFVWLLVLAFTLLCRGEMLLSDSAGIDTVDIIVNPEGMYNSWLGIGRQGLVLLKWLTGSMVYNPYFSGVGTLILLTVACMLWGYLFVYVSGKENLLGTLFFSGILVSHTVLTEQLYFKLQALEISMAFCLMAIAVLCGHIFARDKKVWAFVVSVPLMLLVFSVYQVMNALFLFGAVICFFLYYFFSLEEGEEGKTGKALWLYIFRFAAVFLTGFIFNQVISALFFSDAEYVNNQIQWGQISFGKSIISILAHVKNVALGVNVFYIRTFSLFVILLSVQVIYALKRNKNTAAYLGIVDVLLLFMSPFYMTLISGGATVTRSQLVLPFTVAFMGYAVFMFGCWGGKWMQTAAFVICGITLLYQVPYTMQLNHTAELRYESDVTVANALIEDIMEYQNEDCTRPVVFIGGHEEALGEGRLFGECIGQSVLNWDNQVEPKGYYSTLRIVNFMEMQGVKFNRGNEDETLYSYKVSREMQNWPAEDSIRLVMDLIIVRLSE